MTIWRFEKKLMHFCLHDLLAAECGCINKKKKKKKNQEQRSWRQRWSFARRIVFASRHTGICRCSSKLDRHHELYLNDDNAITRNSSRLYTPVRADWEKSLSTLDDIDDNLGFEAKLKRETLDRLELPIVWKRGELFLGTHGRVRLEIGRDYVR